MIKKIFNCISIHNGGGIVYLSMMHSEIDKKGNLVLLDYRSKSMLKPFINAEIRFFKKSIFRNFAVLIERIKCYIFFKKYLKKLDKREYFCEYYLNGLPPLFRFPINTNKVFILFQNKNLFNLINFFDKRFYFKLKFNIYHILHKSLINLFLKKSDNIIVQTNSMYKLIELVKPNNKIYIQDRFWKKYTLSSYMKFFKEVNLNHERSLFSKIEKITKMNKLFFYPASFDPHKNHKLLLNCFLNISKKLNKNVKLLVTIESSQVPNRDRYEKDIIFLGNQSIQNIFALYDLVDYLIYPSINESLGLPLLEAKLKKLPIIASDMDFVYDVCSPISTFNPYSAKDIYEKISELI